jgi:hypothetical protein
LQSMIKPRINPCHLITSGSHILSDPDIREFAASTGNRLVLCQSPMTARSPSPYVRSAGPELRTSK